MNKLVLILQYEDGGEEELPPIPTNVPIRFPITKIRTIAGIIVVVEPYGTEPTDESASSVEPEAIETDSLPKRGRAKKTVAPRQAVSKDRDSG